VSTINGETNNHTIQEKEPAKDTTIFGMDNSAVILRRSQDVVLGVDVDIVPVLRNQVAAWVPLFPHCQLIHAARLPRMVPTGC